MSLSRRTFLIGGVAAGAAAVGGIGVVAAQNLHSTRRVLHDHGIVSGPDLARPSVDRVTVDYGTIPAATGTVEYGLYVPPKAVTAVLYCLHGRGGGRHDAFDGIGLHRFIAARNLPWAVASLDGGESFWHPRGRRVRRATGPARRARPVRRVENDPTEASGHRLVDGGLRRVVAR